MGKTPSYWRKYWQTPSLLGNQNPPGTRLRARLRARIRARLTPALSPTPSPALCQMQHAAVLGPALVTAMQARTTAIQARTTAIQARTTVMQARTGTHENEGNFY